MKEVIYYNFYTPFEKLIKNILRLQTNYIQNPLLKCFSEQEKSCY